MSNGGSLTAHIEGSVSFLFLGGRYSAVCKFLWLAHCCFHLAGAGHVDRANRVCLACNRGAIGDEWHIISKLKILSVLP